MRLQRLCAILITATLLVATAAGAGSIGRAEFIRRADNICQPKRSDARRLIANGVRLLTKKYPRVQAAGREFVRAWREMRTAYARVGRLPRPARYHRRIARWLHREHHATAVGVKSAKKLRRHHLEAAARLQREAGRIEQRASRPVRNFDFQNCRPL